MKTKLTVLSAFTTLLALVACQREPQAPVNPTYNPDDNTVLTKLILNVSSASGSETKQTAAAVQAGGNNFRGMQDVHLLTYDIPDAKHGPKGADDFFVYDLTSATQGKDFDLGVMMLPGTADSEKGTRVIELALPLQTNAILLYGRATRTGLDADEKLGHVDASGETVADVTFSLKNRMNGQLDKFKLFGDMMGRILTGIMNTGLEVHRPERGYKATDTEDGRYDFWWPIDNYSKALPHWVTEPNPGADPPVEGVHISDGETRYNESTGIKYTMHYGSILWSTLGEKYAAKESLTALEEVMGEAYANIMTLQTGKSAPTVPQPDLKELRAASSAAVLRLTQDLYSILVRVLAAAPTNASEKIAQLLAEEVVKRAKSFFAVDSDGVVSYQPLSIIMTNIANLIPVTTDYSIITDDFFYREAEGDKPKQMGFPINLGLPAGSAIMSFMNPSKMSGDQAWISGLPDGVSGATPLTHMLDHSGEVATGLENISAQWSVTDLVVGTIPGSVGETSLIAILLGAALLLWTGIASWKIMLSSVAGALLVGWIGNVAGITNVPAYYQLLLGGFAFGTVFMATDPVTSAQTECGKWIYGFLIGALCVVVRLFNPGYAEGMMLAILLMNTFAPLIDYIVTSRAMSKRAKKADIA